MAQPNKPLAGLKVIDLTQIYQGPYAAFLFAMAGADVIKVEPVAGSDYGVQVVQKHRCRSPC